VLVVPLVRLHPTSSEWMGALRDSLVTMAVVVVVVVPLLALAGVMGEGGLQVRE
jgi:hypothetical protein